MNDRCTSTRRGRIPYNDGKIIKMVGIRMPEAAFKDARSIASSQNLSFAIFVGQIIEAALKEYHV